MQILCNLYVSQKGAFYSKIILQEINLVIYLIWFMRSTKLYEEIKISSFRFTVIFCNLYSSSTVDKIYREWELLSGNAHAIAHVSVICDFGLKEFWPKKKNMDFCIDCIIRYSE